MTEEEYAMRRKLNDLTFFVWMLAAVMVVMAVLTLPAACERIDRQNELKLDNRPRKSMPYAQRPRRPERETNARD